MSNKDDIITGNSVYLTGLCTINGYEQDDKFLHISGYGNHFNEKNLNNEITDKNSFNEFFSLYNEGKIKPVLNYEHRQDCVIGTIDEITADNTGLFFRASVNRDIPFCGENLIPNIINGVIRNFSTEGIIRGGYDGIVVNPDGSYYVRSFLLTALAIVSVPADWKANFSVANMLRQSEPQKRSKWYLL